MNKPLKKLVLASGVALAFGAQADTFNVTATVDNAITLVETTPFSVGSLYLQAENVGSDEQTTANALMDIDSAGATTITGTTETSGTSNIVSLGGVQTGLISISGAAAFTSVTVTPALNTDLSHVSGSPAIPDIAVIDIDVFDATATGTTASAAATASMTVTTDASGNADIIVAGSIAAADGAADDYEDGSYTGTYDVDVAY